MATGRYDVIVSGGGVAGLALATLMARAGASVLVLERDQQFRDRVRGEWLAPWGVVEVRRAGLEDAFRTVNAHPLPKLSGRSAKARPVATPQGDSALTFYHPDLQQALLEMASRAGAQVVRGAKVVAVGAGDVAEATFVAGSREQRVSARLLVGAEGRSSLTRKVVSEDEQTHRRTHLLAGVRLSHVAGDPSVGYFIVREDAGGLVSVFPQGDGYARAYVFSAGMDAAAFRGPEGFTRFLEASVRLGVPAEVVADARQAGPLAAFSADDSWIEHPARGPLVLIGDAAGISDPTWGMGLGLAFRDARTLAEALVSRDDWVVAAGAYARDRTQYFLRILTAENWQTELQLATGEDADRRRAHALGLWSREPDRAVDLPGLGPDVDVSEEARRRFFGEDLPEEPAAEESPQAHRPAVAPVASD